MFKYRSILLFSIVSPPAPPPSPFSSILPRQERWIICFKPTVTAFKKQYPFSLIHELYWTLITGHEPTERSLFFVPETSHTPCVDSTNENGYYRVFLGGMGGGRRGVLIGILDGGVPPGSPISWSPIPDQNTPVSTPAFRPPFLKLYSVFWTNYLI